MKNATRLMLGNIVVVAGGIALTVFLWLMNLQSHAVDEAQRDLAKQIAIFRHLLEEKGEFRISNGTMLAGDYVINGNFEIPDLIKQTFGGTATVFMGNVRVSTNVLKRDGTRAVGTRLEGPAFEAVFMRHEPFRGEAAILGIPYLTAYDPIRSPEGEVIGALYVGIQKKDLLRSHANSIVGVVVAGVLMIAGFTFMSAVLFRELRESEERYRTVFETTGTATFIVEEDGRIHLVNSQFVAFSGVSQKELEGRMRWSDFVRSPDLERISEYHRVRRVDPASVPRTHEYRFFPLNAPPRDVLCTVNMIPGTSRSVISLTDLTELKAAERELKLTQLSVDNAQACIYRISKEGKILFANEAAVRNLGYSREELLAMTIPDLDPGYPAEIWPAHWEELKEKKHLFFESSHRTREGKILPTEISVTYVEYEGVGYNFAYVRDISERKRAYRLLDAEKQVLERIAAVSPLDETLALLCTRIEEFSDGGLCSVLLLNREKKCLRHCAAPRLPGAYNTALRRVAVREGVGSCGTAAFRKEQVIVTDIAADPLWEGYRELPLCHGLRACWSTPIISAAGEVYGTFAVYYRSPRSPAAFELQTISHAVDLARIAIERQRGEGALRESEERFRQIFHQNEDAVFLLRLRALDLIDVNPKAEEMFGYSREELLSSAPWSLLAPGELQVFTRAVGRLPQERGFHLDRLTNLRKDGTAVTVSIWAKVIQLHHDEVLYCSVRDITERVRMEDEMRSTQARLIHANKMASLGMLVSGIAHEINNPNNFIGVNSGILADAWRDAIPALRHFHRESGTFHLAGLPWAEAEEMVPRLLEGIGRGSERIAAIVKNLREFVRSDTRGGMFPIDLSKVVKDAALILTHLIHRHTDHFQVEIPEDLPSARGNFQQIEQVVINLLSNALQSLPGKSAAVRVGAWYEPEGDTLVLRVRDEGKGMSRRVLEKITEPFFSTRLDEGGTGLGLFISASIIRAHDGSLEFESEPDRGTTVTLKLPAARPDTDQPEQRAGLLS